MRRIHVYNRKNWFKFLSYIHVILGMDWLSDYEALINCYCYSMTFIAPDGIRAKFQGDRPFATKPEPMVNGRCLE